MLWAYTLPPKYALDLRGSLVNAFEPSVDGEEMWRYATRLRLDMTSMGVREEREGQQRERDMPICIKICYNVLPANDANVKSPCLWSVKYWYYMPHFSKCLPIIK